MRSIIRRCIFTASCIALLGTSSKSHEHAAGCVVPERIHLSGLIFMNRTAAVRAHARLAHEPFATLGKSMPSNYSADIGWFTPEQLRGSNYAAAANLPADSTTAPLTVPGLLQTEILHVNEVRQAMSCARAIASYPHDSWPRLIRAATEIHHHELAAAIADYNAVLAYDPQSRSARLGRAEIYYMQHHNKEALTDVDVANASHSGDSYALKALVEAAIGYDDLATADAAQGIAQYDGSGQEDTFARFALGQAYSDLGYFPASIHEFDDVLKKRPHDVQPLLARSFALFSMGDIRGALRDDEAATGARPQWERPYLVRAFIALAIGDLRSALTYAERARRLSPHNSYAELWVLVAKRALHEPPSAVDRSFAPLSTIWPQLVIDVYLGRAPLASLPSTANATGSLKEQMRTCEADFYRGAYLLYSHRRAALPFLNYAASKCPYREYERAIAERIIAGGTKAP